MGSLLAAIMVAVLGFWGSDYLENLENQRMKRNLYVELMGRREEADSLKSIGKLII